MVCRIDSIGECGISLPVLWNLQVLLGGPFSLVVGAGFVIEFFYAGIFVIGIVFNKKVQVNNTAKAHEPGLQKNEQKNIDAKPPEETVIFCAHANKHIPGYKAGYGKRYRQ